MVIEVITIADIIEGKYDGNPCKGNIGNINKINTIINGIANINVMAKPITLLRSHIIKI